MAHIIVITYNSCKDVVTGEEGQDLALNVLTKNARALMSRYARVIKGDMEEEGYVGIISSGIGPSAEAVSIFQEEIPGRVHETHARCLCHSFRRHGNEMLDEVKDFVELGFNGVDDFVVITNPDNAFLLREHLEEFMPEHQVQLYGELNAAVG